MFSPSLAPYADPRNSDCVSADLPRNRLATIHDATPASIIPTAANTATGAVTVYVPTATVYVPSDDTVSATAVPAPATTLPTPPALAPVAPAAPVSDIVSATAAPVSNPPIARVATTNRAPTVVVESDRIGADSPPIPSPFPLES